MKARLAGLVVAGLLLVAAAWAGEAGPLRHAVNVQDYGARGDGVADDTAAIQAAFNAAAAQAKAYPRMWGAGFPEVVFPEGVYRLTRSLVLATGTVPGSGLKHGRATNAGFRGNGLGFAVLRGLGRGAELRQDHPEESILYVGMAYRTLIENLSFAGGRHAIDLWTGNQDVCLPIIRHCRFRDTGSYAIQTPYIMQAPDGEFYGYRDLGPDGALALVEHPDAKPFLYHSTYLYISDCSFVRCRNVLFTTADMATLEDCRIETHPEMSGAAIRTAGLLKLANITGLAHVTPGREQRWIDLDFGTTVWVIARGLRLRSDGPTGLCVVRCRDRFRICTQLNPNMIVLQDSEFQVAGCPEGAAVACEEVPNVVVVSHCRQTGAATVPALALLTPRDPAYFTAVQKPGNLAIVPSGLAYLVNDHHRNLGTDLPAVLQPYARQAIPVEMDARVAALLADSAAQTPTVGEFTAAVTRQVDAASFGLVGDGVTDDTAAIQRALDAAAGEGLAQVDFPGSVYKIGGLLRLPPQLVLRGSGRAVFLAADGAEAGFVASRAQRLAFLNCAFESGTQAIAITVPDGVRARLLFDNCSFANTRNAAIVCRSLAATPAARQASALRCSASVFFNNKQVLQSNVDSRIDNTWITSYGGTFVEGVNLTSKRGWENLAFKKPLPAADPTRDLAAIVNEGRLVAENVLGVPLTAWLSRDFRWVDNAGAAVCDYFRFGGEGGGWTPLKIVAAEPGRETFAAIQNSWTNHSTGSLATPGDKRAAVPHSYLVDCSALPEVLIFRHNVGGDRNYPPYGVAGDSVQTDTAAALEALRPRLFFSANQVPETAGVRKSEAELRQLAEKIP